MATFFMRDKIYSDKIRAVVREYCSNAIDEHKKYQIESPVEVGLRKNGEEIEFFVRDYAKGLDEDSIRNIFGMYFRSTKSESNESIGGFGIGSKSAHSYTDSFFVTSFHNGQKTVYACVLGGSESGVPVGHIYDVDKSSTNESGIEISLVVKNSDVSSFVSRITDFVSYSPNKIEFKYFNDEVHLPFETVLSKNIEGFDFRLVKGKNSNSYYEVVVQMGGVCYDRRLFSFHDTSSVKQGHILIVDIPIGKMSIPISRESFENTTANKNVLARIDSILSQMMQEDLSEFKNTPFFDLFDHKDDGLFFNDSFVGEMFQIKKYTLFCDEVKIIKNTSKANNVFDLVKKNDKYVGVIIPHNTAQSYWLNKIKAHCSKNQINYFLIDNFAIKDSDKLKIVEDNFEAIPVNKIKFEKVKKDKGYSVYTRNYSGFSKIGTMTAIEFHKFVHKSDENLSEQEIIDKNKKTIAETDTHEQLETISISMMSEKSRRCKYYCNSSVFAKEMQNLGWLVQAQPEFSKVVERIDQRIKKEREYHYLVSSVSHAWFSWNHRTSNLIKKEKNAKRISCVWEKIKQEQSLRSKILETFKHSYRSAKINRGELRSILKMK